MSDDNAGPSNEPLQIIDQFKEICDVDTTIAKDFLKESGWNLEAAIHQYFHNDDPEAIENRDNEGQELRHRQQAQANTSANSLSVPNGLAHHTGQNPPSENTHGSPNGAVSRTSGELSRGWLGWVSSLVTNALQFCYNSATNIVLFFYVLFFNPPANRPRRIRFDRPIASPDSLRQQHENRQLMRQQEEEYARALALDKAKRNERILAERQRREEEQRIKEEELKQQQAQEQRKLRQSMLASTLPVEPAENENDIIIIRIRLPTGEHKIRRFYVHESLHWLITYVESIGYEMEDYQIWTSDVPKRSVESLDTAKSFKELEWPRREQVTVDEK